MTKLKFTPDSLWFFRGIRGRKDEVTGECPWTFPPGFYRFKALAMDYKTRQQKVVYHGDARGQHDDGKYFIATLRDWAMGFEPAEEADRPAEEPEPVAEQPEDHGPVVNAEEPVTGLADFWSQWPLGAGRRLTNRHR